MFKRICSHCGKKIPVGEDTYTTTDGKLICRSCKPFYRQCSRCGGLMEIAKSNGQYCDKCNSKIYTTSINDYSTKPNPKFMNFSSDNHSNLGRRYYGFELEFSHLDSEVSYDIFKTLHEKGYLYNKSDSSLYHGVEIVTSPLDKKSVKYLFSEMKAGLDKIATTHNNTDQNAGVHIHVNKETIDPIDRYKLSYLLNFKKEDYNEVDLMYYLSGRCEVNSTHHEEEYCTIGVSNKISYKNIGARHIALNIQNYKTFEFRLFKSTTNVEQLMSYVYMVDSMIDFCHENGINDINISNYVLYIKKKNENKLLMDKIKRFEATRKKLKKYKNFIDVNEITNLIDKIPVSGYYKILSEAGGNSSNRKLLEILYKYMDGGLFNINYDNIVDSVYNNNASIKLMNERLVKMVSNKVEEVEARCA